MNPRRDPTVLRRLSLARLSVLLPIFFIFAFDSGNAERLEVLDVELLPDELAMARIGLYLLSFPRPPANFSVSNMLGLDFIFCFELTLHPSKISNVSACQIVVAVQEDAHVPLTMAENRRA